MKKIWEMLKLLWCKDLSVMSYGLKHCNLKLLFDWVFLGKYQYQYIWGTTLEHAKSFSVFFEDKRYKENLVKWLDKESINEIDQIEKNIKFVLKNTNPVAVIYKKDFWIKESKPYIDKYIEEYTKDMYFPFGLKEENVFYFKHWINEVKDLKQRIKWKDIIDCWAFVWDSALMFSKEFWYSKECGINHIYCIEPNPKNMISLRQTIEKNNLKQKVTTIPLWVGKAEKTLRMNMYWVASFVWDVSFLKDKNIQFCDVKIDTLDNIVENYSINPWLIKRDIEWLEYDSILGAEKTIRNYKPILLISIYHTWKDFYEIKPLIESRNLWYKFMVRHLSTHISEEVELICY